MVNIPFACVTIIILFYLVCFAVIISYDYGNVKCLFDNLILPSIIVATTLYNPISCSGFIVPPVG